MYETPVSALGVGQRPATRTPWVALCAVNVEDPTQSKSKQTNKTTSQVQDVGRTNALRSSTRWRSSGQLKCCAQRQRAKDRRFLRWTRKALQTCFVHFRMGHASRCGNICTCQWQRCLQLLCGAPLFPRRTPPEMGFEETVRRTTNPDPHATHKTQFCRGLFVELV